MRDGKTLINFAGNDYLGLSLHPALITASRDFAERFGAGVAASRLVQAIDPAFSELEAKIAAAKRQESALVLSGAIRPMSACSPRWPMPK